MPAERPIVRIRQERSKLLERRKQLKEEARRRILERKVDVSARKTEPEIAEYVSKLTNYLMRKGILVHPFIYEYFTDPKFFNSLPSLIRQNPIAMVKLLSANSRFYDVVNDSGLYGNEIRIASNAHENEMQRILESGPKVNLEYLRKKEIDPAHVLVFRITQPSGVAKPELYWTTDFYETQKGLRKEISEDNRRNTVLLISNLETISRNGGLIRDINDDNGLSVRQINNKSFNQNLCISRVKII